MIRYPSLEEVIYIYSEVIERTGGKAAISEEMVLESVLEKPMVQFEGEELYPDLFTKAAVLLYSMIVNRPFIDGNKRMALLCALFIIRTNGYHLIASQDNVVETVLGTANGRYHVDHLVNWFKKNSIPA